MINMTIPECFSGKEVLCMAKAAGEQADEALVLMNESKGWEDTRIFVLESKKFIRANDLSNELYEMAWERL